jgi:hypothetical protein
MATMRQEGIAEVLTHDTHFSQEGFQIGGIGRASCRSGSDRSSNSRLYDPMSDQFNQQMPTQNIENVALWERS